MVDFSSLSFCAYSSIHMDPTFDEVSPVELNYAPSSPFVIEASANAPDYGSYFNRLGLIGAWPKRDYIYALRIYEPRGANPVTVKEIWRNLPLELCEKIFMTLLEDIQELTTCNQPDYASIADPTLNKYGLFHPRSEFRPFNPLLAVGGFVRDFVLRFILSRYRLQFKTCEVFEYALRSWSIFRPSILCEVRNLHVEIYKYINSEPKSNLSDATKLLQHVRDMKGLQKLTIDFDRTTYIGEYPGYQRFGNGQGPIALSDQRHLVPEMWSEQLVQLYKTLLSLRVPEVSIRGLGCLKFTSTLVSIMMGRVDDPIDLSVEPFKYDYFNHETFSWKSNRIFKRSPRTLKDTYFLDHASTNEYQGWIEEQYCYLISKFNGDRLMVRTG